MFISDVTWRWTLSYNCYYFMSSLLLLLLLLLSLLLIHLIIIIIPIFTIIGGRIRRKVKMDDLSKALLTLPIQYPDSSSSGSSGGVSSSSNSNNTTNNNSNNDNTTYTTAATTTTTPITENVDTPHIINNKNDTTNNEDIAMDIVLGHSTNNNDRNITNNTTINTAIENHNTNNAIYTINENNYDTENNQINNKKDLKRNGNYITLLNNFLGLKHAGIFHTSMNIHIQISSLLIDSNDTNKIKKSSERIYNNYINYERILFTPINVFKKFSVLFLIKNFNSSYFLSLLEDEYLIAVSRDFKVNFKGELYEFMLLLQEYVEKNENNDDKNNVNSKINNNNNKNKNSFRSNNNSNSNEIKNIEKTDSDADLFATNKVRHI